MAVNEVLEKFDWNLPSFSIPSSDIDILSSPSDFHNALLSKISNARKQIVLSSLYIAYDAQSLVCVFY